MSENILEKIIKRKIERIDVLKKSINLNSFNEIIDKKKSQKLEALIFDDILSKYNGDTKELNQMKSQDKIDFLFRDDCAINEITAPSNSLTLTFIFLAT